VREPSSNPEDRVLLARNSMPALPWWGSRSAGVGGLLWMMLAIAAASGRLGLGIVELLFLIAPVAIVPLGLRLLDTGTLLDRIALWLQPIGALLVVAAFLTASGSLAATMTLPWLAIALLLALGAARLLLRSSLTEPAQICEVAARLYLLVGAVWLFCSRAGASPLDYAEPIVLLTAVHFHYAGFVVPLYAGALGRSLKNSVGPQRVLFLLGAWGAIAAPGLVAAGFVFSPLLRLIAVLLSAASLLLLSSLTLQLAPAIRPATARVLLVISAGSAPIGMALAGLYAAGEFRETLILDISQMAWLHGPLNALGFSLCGLLGWLRVRARTNLESRPWSLI